MRDALSHWLCPDEQARARMLDNSRRVRRARTVASVGMVASLVYTAPNYTWWLVPLFGLSVLNTTTVDVRMRRSDRPEFQAALTMVSTQVLVAVAVAITGGPQSPLLGLIVIPTAFVATRFRPDVAQAAMASAIAMLIAATLLAHPGQTAAHPAGLLSALVLIVGVTAATHALFAAEVQHRRTAVLDPLTGLLNRQGLERRFDEIAQQARLSGAPVALVVCDLDHFKAVNDELGHAVGDAVLRDVAGALRGQVRDFELIYRLGGEEFLLILPGLGDPEVGALAQKLCDAVRAAHPQELTITISVGWAAGAGERLRFGPLFADADRALYAAKAAGRDRVVAAGDPPDARPRALAGAAA